MAILRNKSLVKQNLELWLNDLLLKDGLYRNISIGEVDFYGRDLSLMVPGENIEPDIPFADNRVFQSAFKNWVYECGIGSPSSGVLPPTVASGVAVNGTFYPSSGVGAFSHKVDYPNGRVIFDSPIAAGSIVKADFAHKEVGIHFANSFNNERSPLLIETSYKDNPRATGVDSYPSSQARTLPAIFIDFLGRNSDGYELGSKSLIAEHFGVFHIWARDDYYRDIIEDILASEQHSVILGINFNTAPLPLLAFGERNPNFPCYSSLANVNSPYFWRRIYLDGSSPRKDKALFEVERTRVEFTIRVYPNF